MTRPTDLRQVPLRDVLPPQRGTLTITMSPGQWDVMLAAAYDQGCILLEVDDDEIPVAAYQKEDPS